MTTSLWRVAVTAQDAEEAAAAVVALDAALGTVSAFETTPGGSWQVEALGLTRPDRVALDTLLALAWAGRSDDPPTPVIERIAGRDWVRVNQADFPPIAIGRFFVHGSHHRGPPPGNRVDLLIDAATAFGTGEHATTRGCLAALDGLARYKGWSRVLDMGSGTGILGIAAAKLWQRRVEARDIDREAVRVTRHNARRNGVVRHVASGRSVGYHDRALRRRAPYNLVFANILARPLMRMAKELDSVLATEGVAVLSGLLVRQEQAVLAAHRRRHLRLRRRIAIDGWHTLVLARGARRLSFIRQKIS